MTLTMKDGGFPSLMTDVLTPDVFFGRDFAELMPDIFPRRLGINVPAVNITESPKEHILQLAAPGLTRKDFKIEVDEHVLSISADKSDRKEEQYKGFAKREFAYNSFTRTFQVPANSWPDKIEAKYDNGILWVKIPKKETTSAINRHEIQVS